MDKCKHQTCSGLSRGVLIKCWNCKEQYHIKCIKISDYLFQEINGNNNIVYICDDCCVRNSGSNAEETKIAELDKKVEKIEETLGKILNIISNSEKTSETNEHKKPPTLAQIVKTSNKILIEPNTTTNQQKPSETITQIKSTVDPVKAGIVKIKPTKKGAIVSINNKSDNIETKKQLDLLQPVYNVKQLANFNHRLKISGLTEQYDSKEIPTLIIKQNNLPETTDIKFITFLTTNKKNFIDLIIETDPNTAKLLIQKKKLIIKWDVCFINPHYNILKCTKCLEYGHIKKNCTNKALRCFKCGQDHLFKDCTEAKPTCYNCKTINSASNSKADVNHKNFSSECPIEKKKIQIHKEKLKVSETQ